MAHALARTDESAPRVAVACAVCGLDDAAPFHRESGFTMVRCRGCGFCYVNPRPPPEHRADHHHDYLPSDPAAVAAWQRLMAPVIERSVALVAAAVPPPARACDVGCGYGFFLDALRARGYAVEGCEVGAPGLAECRRLGLDVRSALLEAAEWPAGRFDVVSAFYVIEHVYDPRAFLAHCRRLLRPGGLLVLRWPHSTPLVRLTRPFADLRLYDLPSHLQDFAPATMARLLRGTGFDDVRHHVGGFTRPAAWHARAAAAAGGWLGDLLATASDGRWLLPGASKTTTARAAGP
jgi:SAM-dependent methyltransferase